MANLEIVLQKSIIKWLKAKKIWAWKVNDRFRSGIPDIMIIHKKKVIFLELKTEKGIVKPIQRETMNEIIKAGVNCFVCRSFEDFKEIMGVEYGIVWSSKTGD